MNVLLNALKWLIIVDAVCSWFLPEHAFPRSLTKPILDPVYSPVRALIRPLTGTLDLSPLIALGLLHALQIALRGEPSR